MFDSRTFDARRPGNCSRSVRLDRLKAVAATCGGDFQMQRSMARMSTVIHQSLGRLSAGANLDQLGISLMLLTKMNAEPTLSVMKL